MIQDIPDIEFLAYNQRQQNLVKQRKRKRRSISGQVQESIVEEPILDLKRLKITNLVEDEIVFNQETFEKAKREVKDIKRLEKIVIELEEQLESERQKREDLNPLKEFIVQSNESCFNERRIFYEKAFGLYETTLKVIILFKRAQIDESLASQVNTDLEFIRKVQQEIKESEHGIRILKQEEIKQRIMEVKYQKEISEANREKVEELHSKQEQLWEIINEKLQFLGFPTFGAFDNFKEKTEIITQVENSIAQDHFQIGDNKLKFLGGPFNKANQMRTNSSSSHPKNG